jgi:hypothetical protein
MRTVLENLRAEAERLKTLLHQLSDGSAIHRWHNPDTDPFVFLGGHFAWNDLDDVGHRLQAKLLEEYRRFYSVVHTLLREQPQETLREIEEAHETIVEPIEQQGSVVNPDKQVHFDRALKALDAMLSLLERLHGTSNRNPFFVPDTNALIFNPDIQKWRFDSAGEFMLLLIPSVLSELDSLKVNHRVESVRDKSEKVINAIKECRRRATTIGARLSDGVVLVTGVSRLMSVATEPKMKDSLPWLDASNKDDQLLASMIEIMRLWPRSPVVLVTRDINLQNKAEFAKVPFVEPPLPS